MLVSSLQEEAILSGIVPSPQTALSSHLKHSPSKSNSTRVRRGSIAQSAFSVQDEFLNSPAMKLRRGVIVVMATKRFFYIFQEKRNTIKLLMKAGSSEAVATTTSFSIAPGAPLSHGASQLSEKRDPFYDWMVSFLLQWCSRNSKSHFA